MMLLMRSPNSLTIETMRSGVHSKCEGSYVQANLAQESEPLGSFQHESKQVTETVICKPTWANIVNNLKDQYLFNVGASRC